MSDYTNELIYGKNPLERVVSLEINDNRAEVFVQQEDGSVKSTILPNRFWLLTHKKSSPGSSRMDGDLHYKWGRQFDTEEQFKQACKESYKYDSFCVYNPKEAFLIKDGVTYFKGMHPQDVTILSFDIETNGITMNLDSQVYLISNTFRKNGVITKKLFSVDEYLDQEEMIDEWCKWVREMDPSVLCGHNIQSYDLPYLNNITQLKLGRNGSNLYMNSRESKFRVDGSRDLHYRKCFIYGREIIDTLFLSYRYDAVAKKHESYGLKAIIKTEGLEKSDRTFYDASTIKTNWNIPEEREKIKQYCIDDSDDGLALYDLMVPAIFYMAQSVPKPFQMMTESATGSQLNAMFIRAYLQKKHSIPKADEPIPYQGATSFGIPGVFSNCVKVDLVSCYPYTILSHKLYNPIKDPKAYLLSMTDYFLKQRLYHKKLAKETGSAYHEGMQQSVKIAINSLYGFLGSPGLNFNSPDIAAKITEYARGYINTALLWASGRDTEYWMSVFKEKTI